MATKKSVLLLWICQQMKTDLSVNGLVFFQFGQGNFLTSHSCTNWISPHCKIWICDWIIEEQEEKKWFCCSCTQENVTIFLWFVCSWIELPTLLTGKTVMLWCCRVNKLPNSTASWKSCHLCMHILRWVIKRFISKRKKKPVCWYWGDNCLVVTASSTPFRNAKFYSF